jgi:NAD(P)-dependent dehydrogenase (short-subunit alcohol dehydrogenase family)
VVSPPEQPSAAPAASVSTVSIVTGGVRGIGLAVARALSARGDSVHIVYRSSEQAASALADEFDGRVHRADVTQENELEALAAAVLLRDGRIDHAIHCVGPFSSGPLLETDPADFRHLFEHNTTSAFLLARCFAPHLRAVGGSFLFFGCAGLAGLRGRREAAAYAAAKSALLVLVRSLALEEGPRGVRANMISPGIIPHGDADTATHDARRQALIPLGRPGTPQDVASAASFLTSAAAAHITGVDLEVAGGWML